ncbi:putative nuclease HARBI1 [Tachysurus ichikawai]
MACPLDEDPVDVKAQIIQVFFLQERVIRPCIDVFAYPNEYFKERYRFSKDFVGNSEHVGKATVCRAVRTVWLALKQFLPTFVQFPGHKPLLVIKEELHRVAGRVDRGYPCQPHLMTPYPEPGPQTRFNLAHRQTQAKVEMTIGILKSLFQCVRGLRSAVLAPARKPLTIYMLESADLDEQIRMLYEYIFPLVEKIHPTGAKHITRLVIEGENNYDLVNLIAEPNRLHAHVEQIAAVLRAREAGQDVVYFDLES